MRRTASDTDGNLSGGNGPLIAIGGEGGDEFEPVADSDIDPANFAPIVEPAAPAGGKRKRGRPPGSGRKSASQTGEKKNASVSVSVSGLESLLIGIHMGLATLTKQPDFAIDKEEANLLAKATAKVMALYEVKIDPRAEAWGQLAVAMGVVYGPRLMKAQFRAPSRSRPAPAPVAAPDLQPFPNAVSPF